MFTLQQDRLWRNWIKALESGKFRQSKGKLRYKGNNCCLGVACALIGSKGENNETLDDKTVELYGFQNNCGFDFKPSRAQALLDQYLDPIDNLAKWNDATLPKARDYSNVLPKIKAFYKKNKYK